MSRRKTDIDPATGEVSNEDPHIRPFVAWLQEQSRGASQEELSIALHNVIKAVKETGKKGSITYTISIEPLKNTAGELVKVADEIKIKLPEFDRDVSVFYTDKHGNLVRNNPNQEEIEGLRGLPSDDLVVTPDLKDAR